MGCFSPECWSKFIGFVELLLNLASSLFFAYYLYTFVTGGEESVVEASAKIDAVAQYYSLGYDFFISVLAILLVVSVLGFIMAIVLIKGAFKRDYTKLNYWMVYTIMAVGVSFLILISYGGHIWSVVIRSFAFVVIRGIMIWSVYVDLKEIEGDLKTEDKKGLANATADTAI